MTADFELQSTKPRKKQQFFQKWLSFSSHDDIEKKKRKKNQEVERKLLSCNNVTAERDLTWPN